MMKDKHEKWKRQMHKEMRRGMLSMWVLWALKKKGGKMYGYEIIQKFQAMPHRKFDVKAGTIYPILRRLEKRGLVKSTWEKQKDGGPRRRYYEITSDGKKAAELAFSEWRKMMKGFKEFLSDLFGVE